MSKYRRNSITQKQQKKRKKTVLREQEEFFNDRIGFRQSQDYRTGYSNSYHPYNSYTAYRKRMVVVAEEDPSNQFYDVDYPTQVKENDAKKHFKYVESGDAIFFYIPKNNIRVRKMTTSRTVQTCVYDSVKEYCSSILGINLNSNDKDWFINHKKVESFGIGWEDGITVLNDLLSVYKVGVSKIFVKKGLVVQGSALQFLKSLGQNPLALQDLTTSNAEFEDSIGVKFDNINVDYVDVPEYPCVFFSRNTNSVSNVAHCMFKAPRSIQSDNFEIALQFERLRDIKYLTPPPTFGQGDQVPFTFVADIYECICEDGKTLRSKTNSGTYYTTNESGSSSNSFNSSNSNNVKEQLPGFVNSTLINNPIDVSSDPEFDEFCKEFLNRNAKFLPKEETLYDEFTVDWIIDNFEDDLKIFSKANIIAGTIPSFEQDAANQTVATIYAAVKKIKKDRKFADEFKKSFTIDLNDLLRILSASAIDKSFFFEYNLKPLGKKAIKDLYNTYCKIFNYTLTELNKEGANTVSTHFIESWEGFLSEKLIPEPQVYIWGFLNVAPRALTECETLIAYDILAKYLDVHKFDNKDTILSAIKKLALEHNTTASSTTYAETKKWFDDLFGKTLTFEDLEIEAGSVFDLYSTGNSVESIKEILSHKKSETKSLTSGIDTKTIKDRLVSGDGEGILELLKGNYRYNTFQSSLSNVVEKDTHPFACKEIIDQIELATSENLKHFTDIKIDKSLTLFDIVTVYEMLSEKPPKELSNFYRGDQIIYTNEAFRNETLNRMLDVWKGDDITVWY